MASGTTHADWVLLWTNPDTTVAMDNTTLNIDTSAYSEIKVIARVEARSGSLLVSTCYFPVGTNTRIFGSWAGKLTSRVFENTDTTKIIVNKGKLVGTYGSGTETDENNAFVPYKIYAR